MITDVKCFLIDLHCLSYKWYS